MWGYEVDQIQMWGLRWPLYEVASNVQWPSQSSHLNLINFVTGWYSLFPLNRLIFPPGIWGVVFRRISTYFAVFSLKFSDQIHAYLSESNTVKRVQTHTDTMPVLGEHGYDRIPPDTTRYQPNVYEIQAKRRHVGSLPSCVHGLAYMVFTTGSRVVGSGLMHRNTLNTPNTTETRRGLRQRACVYLHQKYVTWCHYAIKCKLW